MVLTTQPPTKPGITDKLLRWINLREGEGNRTLLMFAFYTTTSSGLVWLEACSVELFLAQYGAMNLPLIYIASSAIRIGLGLLYSWMQRFLPLRWVIVFIALLTALPLPLFWFGLRFPGSETIGGVMVLSLTVLLMQLWLEASHALNDLNASITANQLFNVREIKRTYPLISSGNLVADVVSGFSLPLLLALLPRGTGLPTVIMLSFGMMVLGAGILFYLSQTYQQSFPKARRRRDDGSTESATPRVQGEMKRYTTLLQIFFGLAQVFLLLIEFQFLSQLGQQSNPAAVSDMLQRGEVASFLGIFNGSLGICEIAMQWLFSSRIIDRVGVFTSVMLLPIVVMSFSSISMTGKIPVFSGVVGLRFLYELLHYTLFLGVGPFLFYSVPEHLRDRQQAQVRGIAEPVSTAATGIGLLVLVSLGAPTGVVGQNIVFGLMILLAAAWLGTIVLLRSHYVELLVLSAGRGKLNGLTVDLRALKQAAIDKLDKPEPEADKRACIEFLNQIDPKNTGEVLAPLLGKLSPMLQHKSLEVMLNYPNPTHLDAVKRLLSEQPAPEVMALALQYIWLVEESLPIGRLRSYLSSAVHPMIRGTAASLILRRGTPTQKAEATNTLRLMLTHQQKQERVMGCRALGEAVYLQALRLYIPNLLRDQSLQVRRAVLEAIGATRLEEYYPSLLQGLHHKPTRRAAKKALVRLSNDALPMLVQLADDRHRSDLVRNEALSAIGEIGTREAIDLLIARLKTAWGNTRWSLLRTLLKIPQEQGIEGVLDQLGRFGIEQLINQEMMFMGQVYAGLADLLPERVRGQEADLLRRSLANLPPDGIDRLFLLMKFLYPVSAIQVAAFNLKSGSRSDIAQALEILDNTLDIANKRAFLTLLERNLVMDKLQSLSELAPYTPMRPHDRLKYLLDLRHFLSDWSLACCFHLSRCARWRLTSEQILACLSHPRGFVREAVLSYLHQASPQALMKVLPSFTNDPNLLVASQVQQIIQALTSYQRAILSVKNNNILRDSDLELM